MISIIAERYNIHPQTLRLYEREGLIKPARTAGNTRLYGQDEIKKLEMILALTRDLGVNLAGVEVVLQLARMMDDADMEFDRLLDYIRQTLLDKRHGIERENALVKSTLRNLTKMR
jgi:MerR family transcriptional regulator/heat shock protein HspR